MEHPVLKLARVGFPVEPGRVWFSSQRFKACNMKRVISPLVAKVQRHTVV